MRGYWRRWCFRRLRRRIIRRRYAERPRYLAVVEMTVISVGFYLGLLWAMPH